MANSTKPCGCGRSPTGLCVGFHALDEQEWIEGKTQLIHNVLAGHANFLESLSHDEWEELGKDPDDELV